MQRFVVPRRGSTAAEPRVPSSTAVARYGAWLDALLPAAETVLTDAQSDTALVAEFRESGLDLAGSTPLGAAVSVALLVHAHSVRAYRDFPDVIDAWVGARGLAFAVTATVELFGVAVSPGYSGNSPTEVHVHRDMTHWRVMESSPVRFGLAARLRQHLAAASDEDYAAARAVITGYRFESSRDLTDWQRVLTSFLTPEQTDWVDADLKLPVTNYRDHLVPWLVCCSISTEGQAAEFGKNAHWWSLSQEPRALWTAVDGAGPALLPALTGFLSGYMGSDGIQRVLWLIACLPTDAAFQTLLDSLDKKYYTAAVLEAAQQFPRRALRLLANSARQDGPRGQAAANMLRLHTLARRELAEAELSALAPACARPATAD
jgi:hypothetical protein